MKKVIVLVVLLVCVLGFIFCFTQISNKGIDGRVEYTLTESGEVDTVTIVGNPLAVNGSIGYTVSCFLFLSVFVTILVNALWIFICWLWWVLCKYVRKLRTKDKVKLDAIEELKSTLAYSLLQVKSLEDRRSEEFVTAVATEERLKSMCADSQSELDAIERIVNMNKDELLNYVKRA